MIGMRILCLLLTDMDKCASTANKRIGYGDRRPDNNFELITLARLSKWHVSLNFLKNEPCLDVISIRWTSLIDNWIMIDGFNCCWAIRWSLKKVECLADTIDWTFDNDYKIKNLFFQCWNYKKRKWKYHNHFERKPQ